jgi:hypothetical protein
MRDSLVHVMRVGNRRYYVSEYSGAWRSDDGVERGDDLISLAALRLGCRPGKAIGRLCRAIGLVAIPTVREGATDV